MKRKPEPKSNWKHFVFVPKGADRETHGIKYGDDGYLHLSQRRNNGDYLCEYDVYYSRFKPGSGGRSVATDWTGLKEALLKHQVANPQPPTVFTGEYQHCREGREVRKRLLHAACREYQHPEALADDI